MAKSLISLNNKFNIIDIIRLLALTSSKWNVTRSATRHPLPPTPACICAVPHKNIFWNFPAVYAIPLSTNFQEGVYNEKDIESGTATEAA